MTEKPIHFELERADEAWKRVAKVQVSPERMEEVRRTVVDEIRKEVRRPGFRKGKVPVKIIRTEYAGEVEKETLERVIPLAYREILTAHEDLDPVAEPRVSNLSMDEGQPVGFDLEIEVRPEIELQGLQDLEVERFELVIDDARLDQAKAELAERNAQWVPVERGAQPGDALTIEYCPLAESGEPREGDRTKGYSMELGGEGVLPEFNAALEGLEPGEDTTVEVHYPADYPREDLAGKTLHFQVAVEDIKEKRIPELDDDFAQSVSPHPTLDELRQAVREDLVKASEAESRRHFRERLVDAVLDANAVPVPPSLEARYLQAMMQDMARNAGREMDAETARKLQEAYAPAARRATQRWLLLDHVKKARDIQVGSEEMDVRIEELAAERGVSPEEYRQALTAGRRMDHLKLELEEERAFDWLADQVQVEVVRKTSEQLEQERQEREKSQDEAGA